MRSLTTYEEELNWMWSERERKGSKMPRPPAEGGTATETGKSGNEASLRVTTRAQCSALDLRMSGASGG
jgi:hypothetical protein